MFSVRGQYSVLVRTLISEFMCLVTSYSEVGYRLSHTFPLVKTLTHKRKWKTPPSSKIRNSSFVKANISKLLGITLIMTLAYGIEKSTLLAGVFW